MAERYDRATSQKPMDDNRLMAIVKTQIDNATGNMGGEISEQRRQSMEYYLGEPFGNEIDGRSSVVSTDVQDTIESVMPDIVSLFTVGDDVVAVEPTSQEDEATAAQAADYLNYIWNKDNDGFNNFYDWFKDALMQINGFIKVYWDDAEEVTEDHRTGLTQPEFIMLMEEAAKEYEVDVEEYTEYPPETPILGMDGFEAILIDCKLKKTRKKGRVRVETVPPEEFLIERRARTIEGASFCAHKVRKTASKLVEMGFDPKVIRTLPSTDEQEYNQERVARFNRDDEWPYDEDYPDETTREIWVYECYIRVDYDGDDIAELRKVLTAGPGYKILENVAVDMVPFVSITPIRMPHKFYGRSLSELVEDLQLIKSTLWRLLLDNLYQQNVGREAVSNMVNLDDALTNRIGGKVRVDTDAPDVAGHFFPMITPDVGGSIYPMMEYIDTVRETRSGITRYGQGLDPDSLNTTASGMNMLLGRQQQRVLLMGRVFAEGGVKDAFRKILRLVIHNQDKERVIRLRNEWVPMDPASWNVNMDVTINVGIGHGTREQKMLGLRMLLEMLEKAVAYQGGAQGPLVDLEGLYNAAKKFIQELGFKDAEQFINDPSTPEAQMALMQQMNQPDPEAQKEQVRAQTEMQKAQLQSQTDLRKQQAQTEMDMIKLAAEERKNEAELELKTTEAIARYQLEVWKAQVAAGTATEKLNVEASIAEMRQAGEMEKATMQAEASKDQSAVNVQVGQDDNLAAFLESMTEVAQGMKQTSDAMSEAVQQMNAPKEIVRDKEGKVQGVRLAN